jgi:hypothetical protein
MDADDMMGRVAEHTHYFPESWRGQCASLTVRDEFLSIFKFKAQVMRERERGVYAIGLLRVRNTY